MEPSYRTVRQRLTVEHRAEAKVSYTQPSTLRIFVVSLKLLQFPPSLIVKVILAIFYTTIVVLPHEFDGYCAGLLQLGHSQAQYRKYLYNALSFV